MIQIPTQNPTEISKMPLLVDIVIVNAEIHLIEAAPGRKLLRFQAPNGIAASIPLDDIGVENLVQALRGTKLSIARI